MKEIIPRWPDNRSLPVSLLTVSGGQPFQSGFVWLKILRVWLNFGQLSRQLGAGQSLREHH